MANFDERCTFPPFLTVNSSLLGIGQRLSREETDGIMNGVTCTPDPNLLESMRSVGYSLDTAVADIIDNSIAARAQQISVRYFDCGEAPYIAIIDDGDGMNEHEAINAMKLAGSSPSCERKASDLGRFGLGLKAASLSQARSLLLCSVKDGRQTTLRWDLDHVATVRDWELEVLDERQTELALPEKVRELMPSTHGTCVLWRNLDRLETVAGTSLQDMDQAMAELSNYLGLVFHRFTNPYPDDNIQCVELTVNGMPVPKRDPFLTENMATQPQRLQRIPGTEATLHGYTLPYQNKLTAEDRRLLNLTPEKGHTLFDTQGFYVYRAHRLITWGSWYRLLPRKDGTKLSRVRVDIPNSMDAEWTLDIKKSQATPPKTIRDAMKRYVSKLAAPSRKTQKWRGRKTSEQPEARIWDVISDRDGTFRYEINKDNPYVKNFIASLSDGQQHDFAEMMKILAVAFPYEDMQSRLSGDQASEEQDLDDEEIRGTARDMWLFCSQCKGQSPEEFVNSFKDKEPFSLCKNGEDVLSEVSHEQC